MSPSGLLRLSLWFDALPGIPLACYCATAPACSSTRSSRFAVSRAGSGRGSGSMRTEGFATGIRLALLLRAQLANDVLERVDDLVRLDLGLLECDPKIERLGWRPERKHERLGSRGVRL